MKKKIKLQAWEDLDGRIMFGRPGADTSRFPDIKRCEEFDIEKEIEVPDKLMEIKVRAYWDTPIEGIVVLRNDRQDPVNFVEKIPGSVQVTREQLREALEKQLDIRFLLVGEKPFDDFCRALGFGDE